MPRKRGARLTSSDLLGLLAVKYCLCWFGQISTSLGVTLKFHAKIEIINEVCSSRPFVFCSNRSHSTRLLGFTI